ncbi:PTS IIA-like nitrogen regulatory protein PtsN [Salaquimonas pukyongi]|uniref:PTS IIA-like nitrogen regulatory protein PtsN n=1 Tax=Salaquimonas pukyongi TaxID=2712698 RepID=UPI00096B6A92|nr:PTS IIA-like nitrogen regulatory protein PtsN [Salaquimonas pukyongi]
MDLNDLIGPDDVFAGVKASCKKSLLQELSDKAARKTKIAPETIFSTLLDREKLGSTGIGNGIAIPHGRVKGLDKITGIAVQLAKPVDFEAMDDQPVDLVILLLAPEDSGADHLKALARIARVLKQPKKLSNLRAATDSATIYDLLTSKEASHAA